MYAESNTNTSWQAKSVRFIRFFFSRGKSIHQVCVHTNSLFGRNRRGWRWGPRIRSRATSGNVGFDVDLSGISGDKPGPPHHSVSITASLSPIAYSPPNSFPAGFSLLIALLNSTCYPNPRLFITPEKQCVSKS